MSLLPETNMINTFSELNKFSDRVGAKSRDEIILKLVETQERITENMAKLVTQDTLISVLAKV